jgi:hypothetical protein
VIRADIQPAAAACLPVQKVASTRCPPTPRLPGEDADLPFVRKIPTMAIRRLALCTPKCCKKLKPTLHPARRTYGCT